MVRLIERLFESVLWNSRFVVLIAVLASLASSFAVFFLTAVDVIFLVSHVGAYWQAPDCTAALVQQTDVVCRARLRESTVTHVVEVVDGFLLATVLLIFALGLYELFISDIDEAIGSRASSRILIVSSLDDLKSRLAKVILMILIVKLFEKALQLPIKEALDLLYLGGAIALVGLALYLTHVSEDASEHGLPTKRNGGNEATEKSVSDKSH
jgi:uncharacterized membrane protein YqhA